MKDIRAKLIGLLLYGLPFLLVAGLHYFELYFVTEITGYQGVGQGISQLLSGLFVVYFIGIVFVTHLSFRAPIWKQKSLLKIPVTGLVICILALLFLPVRQKIAVVQVLPVEQGLYWLERPYFTGAVKVYYAHYQVNKFPPFSQLFIQPRLVYQDQQGAHEAFLEVDTTGRVVLGYSKQPSDQSYLYQSL